MDSARSVIWNLFFGDLSQSEKLSEIKPPLKGFVSFFETGQISSFFLTGKYWGPKFYHIRNLQSELSTHQHSTWIGDIKGQI